VAETAARVARHGAGLHLFQNPHEAVRGANAIYTDVWTSMGQERQTERKSGVFAPYQVTADLMREAGPGALFMHCLPAHRGEEVTEEVIESPSSVVFDQAENRLHTHKAVLLTLMKD
jgi:ornithine carbamoyltransferase